MSIRFPSRLDVDDFATVNRRALLRGLGASALVTATGGLFARSVWGSPVFTAYPFSLGVASGDPAPDGFVIWTKIAPKPLERGGGMPKRPVEVDWSVATDERMRQVVQKGTAIAHPELGHAVHVEVGGLEPARDYFYQFTIGGERSRVGRARTLPPAGAPVAQLRFAVAGCQRYEDGYFTAYRRIAAERFDFVFHYGDYIYEYRVLRPGERQSARRARHARRSGRMLHPRRLPASLRAVPARPGPAGRARLRAVRHELRRSRGRQRLGRRHDRGARAAGAVPAAPRRRLPGLVRAPAGAPGADAARARHPRLPALRGRRPAVHERARHAAAIARRRRAATVRGSRPIAPKRSSRNRTMLGETQERWLYDGFKTAKARWTLLAQQVIVMRNDRNPDPNVFAPSLDKWDGAVAARDRLFAAVEAAKLGNLVVVTGDIHQNWAGELKKNFADEKSATLGVEFVATSISSLGDGFDINDNFKALSQQDPHMKFFNGQRGYVRHVVTPERWQADYQVLDKVSVPDGRLSTRKSFVVENGKSGLAEA